MYKFGLEITPFSSGTICPELVAQDGRYIQFNKKVELNLKLKALEKQLKELN